MQKQISNNGKRSGQIIEPIVKCLIRRQIGKPRKPMTANIIINFLNLMLIIKHGEKVTGHEFLIGKFRLEITQALLMNIDLRIVEMADQTI